MKTALVILLFASSAFAQSVPAPTGSAAAPGCGPADFSFAVRSDGSSHPVSQPEPGKALVYFLQDDTAFDSSPRPTLKWAVDGNWIGGTHGDTYFYLSLAPGEHHLCSEWQSAVIVNASRQSAAAHFTAEAGKAYYFRAQDFYWRLNGVASLKLAPVDSDEAQLLMTGFGFSTSHPKK
jgi:uncharacterized protein DUF2846